MLPASAKTLAEREKDPSPRNSKCFFEKKHLFS